MFAGPSVLLVISTLRRVSCVVNATRHSRITDDAVFVTIVASRSASGRFAISHGRARGGILSPTKNIVQKKKHENKSAFRFRKIQRHAAQHGRGPIATNRFERSKGNRFFRELHTNCDPWRKFLSNCIPKLFWDKHLLRPVTTIRRHNEFFLFHFSDYTWQKLWRRSGKKNPVSLVLSRSCFWLKTKNYITVINLEVNCSIKSNLFIFFLCGTIRHCLSSFLRTVF